MKLIYALRSLILYVVIAVTLCIGVPFVFLTSLFGFKGPFAIIRFWTRLVRHAARWICGIRYKIEGLENVPNEPIMVFSRHESAWETLCFSDIFPMNCFVVKKQLLHIPVFGWAFKVAKHIPIDRDKNVQAMKQVIKDGRSRIKEGISIVVFPEGTRMPPGKFRTFHKGGAGLARFVKVPVIPVVHNAGTCWKRNGFIKYPGLITVKIGKPIDVKKMDVDEINDAIFKWMEKNY